MKKKIRFFIQLLIPSFIVNTYMSIRYMCFVHPFAKIYWPQNVKLAQGVRVGRGTTIIAQDNRNSIVIGRNTIIEDYCNLNNKGGYIKIGENSSLNHYSIIQSTKDNSIEIGDHVAMAPYTRILPNHEYHEGEVAGTVHASTRIGNNVWFGAGVTLIIGKNIGDNCIVGANSVITRDIPSNTVSAGIPAKKIKTFDEYVQ